MKLDEINLLLDDHQIDILCLSETWLSSNILDTFLIFPGYQLIREDRVARRGGGVAILLRNEIRSERLNLRDNANGPLETLWLSLTWPGGRPTTVGVAYRPPDSPVTASLNQLRKQLRAALCTGKPVFLLGDLNFNILSPTSPEVRRYTNIIDDLNMSQLVNQPTHLLPTPTALDHVITNHRNPPPAVAVLPDSISDHQPVIITASLGRIKKRGKKRTTRSWHRADWDAISLTLLYADWEPMRNAHDVDTKLHHFMRVWNSVMDQHCPTKTVTAKHPCCPWLQDNPPLRALMTERDTARDAWRRLRTPESRANYTRLRNSVKSAIIRARRDFLCGMMISGGQRHFWPTFKKFAMGSSKPHDDVLADNPCLANTFNSYFATVGSKVAESLGANAAVSNGAFRPPTVCSTSFRFKPATLPELSNAIRCMGHSRAVGVDEVPIEAVRQCFPVIGPRLLEIVNCSLVNRTFPSDWKTACVVPIHKAGDPSVPANNRPISLLSTLSKILEKVACHQLRTYLCEHNILSATQYAYRPSHSTEDALLDVVEGLVKNTDSGEISSITAVDLSKAFDSVAHDLLLTKLQWYGIDPVWFKSYLTDRKQMVRGGTTTLPVTDGVPEGSIIGPILFTLFTNDLPSHLSHGRLISYADDTQFLDHAPPNEPGLGALKTRLEQTIGEAQNWFSANSLKMNNAKTDFVLVGTKQSLENVNNFHFDIDNERIEPSEKTKVLGIIVDSKLTWEKHVTSVVQKCNHILISLYRLRHYFTSDVLKIIIQAYVFPHITYCLSVWGGTNKCQLDRVQKVRNFAARIVSGTKRNEHITPAMEALGWPKIDAMIAERDAAKVAKALSGSLPPAIQNLFTPCSSVALRETRLSVSSKLHLPRWNLKIRKRVFSYRAAMEWNKRH